MLKTSVEKITTLCHGTVIQFSSQNQPSFFLHLSIDSRKVKSGDVFVCLKGQRVDGHQYIHQAIEKGAIGLICQDSIELETVPSDVFVILVKSASQALLDLASEITKLYHSILVTGSAGKTTTKKILGTLMPFSHTTFGNYNTPIGLPVALTDVPSGIEWLVCELSASYPGEIETLLPLFDSAQGAILTGIGNSHTEFFSSKQQILETKAMIFDKVSNQEACFANGHMEGLETGLKKNYPFVSLYGFHPSMDVPITITEVKRTETIFHFVLQSKEFTFSIPCFGKHYVLNAVASIALVLTLFPSTSLKDIQDRLNQFEPGKGRGKVFSLNNNCLCIDESYNANPLSMRAALEAFSSLSISSKVLVLGDMLELGHIAEQEHIELGRIAKNCDLKQVFYIGQYGNSFSKGFTNAQKVTICTTLKEAYDQLQSWIQKDTAILVKASNGIGLHTLVDRLIADTAS